MFSFPITEQNIDFFKNAWLIMKILALYSLSFSFSFSVFFLTWYVIACILAQILKQDFSHECVVIIQFPKFQIVLSVESLAKRLHVTAIGVSILSG